MAKWKKRLKRGLKKVAPLLAAGLGAAALSRKRATDAPGDAYAKAKNVMTSDRAYTDRGYDDPIMTGGVGVKASRRPTWTGDQRMVDNDPFNYYPSYKKGGRVKGAGKAKRGLGRAFSKGRK